MSAETIILGSMLASDANAWDLRPKLRTEMFADKWHQAVFSTICGLMDEGKTANVGLVSGRLGHEREDGYPVPVLLSVMVGEADEAPVSDFLDELVTGYRLRAFRASLKAAEKEASTHGLDAALGLLTPALDDLASNQIDGPVSVQSLVKTIIRKAAAGPVSGGLQTGIRAIDDMIGMMMPGELWAIGGAPGAGKTVMGAQIARHFAKVQPVLFVELEMMDEQLATRFLSADTGMSAHQVRMAELSFEDMDRLKDAEDRIQALRMDIWDRAGLTIEQIKQRASSDRRTRSLGALVVDHLRLVGASKPKLASKWDRYEYVTMEMKKLAKDLGIVAIMLSQLTKGSQKSDNPNPHLTDLDGGGALEQDADGALILFRRDTWIKENKLGGHYPDRHAEEKNKWMEQFFDCEGITEVHLVKHRSGAVGKLAKLRLRGKESRFDEV